jgi:phospholipid transport system substrate-binding protein
MNRIFSNRLAAVFAIGLSLMLALPVHAADEAADALIQRQSVEVLKGIQTDAAIQGGDISRIVALVDSTVMPNVNFKRMTAAAVGPTWRQASAEQQQRLQEEFKTLMVRTYAGALAQAKNLRFNVKPMRAAQDDKEVVVRTEITGRGDPVQLDYRMEKTPGDGAGWKIYNLNVMGVWLVETYRSQFAQEISAKGIDGLISTLTERNRANSKKG